MKKWQILAIGLVVFFMAVIGGVLLKFGARQIGVKRAWQLFRINTGSDVVAKNGIVNMNDDPSQNGSLTMAYLGNAGEKERFWNLKGERAFRIADDASLQYYDICRPGESFTQGGAIKMSKTDWRKAAVKGYVHIWLQGYEGQEKTISRAIAFSGFPFGSDKSLKCAN